MSLFSGPIHFALDVGRGMRSILPAVLDGLRKELPALLPAHAPVHLAAIGDPACHLIQTAECATAWEIHAFLSGLHACDGDRSYELAMYYYARHRPESTSGKGLLVMMGNGPYRDAVSAAHARHSLGSDVSENPYTEDILGELQARMLVRMLYLSRGVYDMEMHDWEALLGSENVTVIDDPRRTARAIRVLAPASR